MKKLLIVEDDEELHELYRAMLEGLDVEIVPAHDIQEAEGHLARMTPDLLILDILLGDGTGDELYRHVRQDARTLDLPVVVVSVLTEDHVRSLMDMDSLTVFLRKPFRKEHLLKAVHSGLSLSSGGQAGQGG